MPEPFNRLAKHWQNTFKQARLDRISNALSKASEGRLEVTNPQFRREEVIYDVKVNQTTAAPDIDENFANKLNASLRKFEEETGTHLRADLFRYHDGRYGIRVGKELNPTIKFNEPRIDTQARVGALFSQVNRNNPRMTANISPQAMFRLGVLHLTKEGDWAYHIGDWSTAYRDLFRIIAPYVQHTYNQVVPQSRGIFQRIQQRHNLPTLRGVVHRIVTNAILETLQQKDAPGRPSQDGDELSHYTLMERARVRALGSVNRILRGNNLGTEITRPNLRPLPFYQESFQVPRGRPRI